jgi:PAS domain S-box-containing protein
VNFKATESQFATLAERLPHLVWSTRADGFCDYFNGRWYEFTGLSAEQSLGTAWRSAVHPDDQASVNAAWLEALAQGTPFEAEYRLRGASGRYCWVLARGLPDRDPDGAVVRWFGTCTMIDAQKQAETCLRVLEEQYRLALDAAKLGTWRIDIDTQIISWDEGSCALFGLPAEGLRSIPLEEALQRIHPEDRESVREKIAAAIAPGSTGLYEVECRTLLKGGSVRWTRSNGRVIRSEQGSGSRIEGLSGVIGDITDMRAAAEAQDLLTRELTHRVKNLFAIANGMVSMTARTAKDTKEMATALRGRLGALSRAHELVQPPLTQIPSGSSRVGLDQLIEAVLAPYRQEAGAKVHYGGPAVSVGSNTTTSLALVMHELATNAAKYGSLSSPEGQLDIDWTEHEGSVHLVWRETGGPRISDAPKFEGFGSQLAQRSITGQLGGALDREWRSEGLCVRMSLPIDRLST